MTPFNTEPVGRCEQCGNEIYKHDYIYNGRVMCRECCEEVQSDNAIVEYIKDHADAIARYFNDVGIDSGETPVLEILRDFREWVQEDFDSWVEDNAYKKEAVNGTNEIC